MVMKCQFYCKAPVGKRKIIDVFTKNEALGFRKEPNASAVYIFYLNLIKGLSKLVIQFFEMRF